MRSSFLNHYDCVDRRKISTEHECCSMNLQAIPVDRSFFSSASKIKSNYEGNGLVDCMNLPVENKSSYLQVFDQIIPLEWTDSSTSCSISSSLNGDEDQVQNQEAIFLQASCRDEEDKVITIDSLTAELKAERLVVCGLYIELDEERKASAVAANQAMRMITKLQEEKVALKIESIRNQRMMDEQAEYDHEVFQLLNELVMKLERDKFELENELEIYKEKVADYEGKTKAKMMPKCVHCSCLVNNNVLDSKNTKQHEESVVELEIDRLWILDKLKKFDETLIMTSTNDLDEGVDEEAEVSRFSWTRNVF